MGFGYHLATYLATYLPLLFLPTLASLGRKGAREGELSILMVGRCILNGYRFPTN
jgi:hypothetical protein